MQSLKMIPERFFSKGMNNTDKPETLKEGECVLAQNCLLGDETIKKGPGSAALFDLGFSNEILGGISTDTEIYVACNEPGDSLCYIYRYTGSGTPVAVSGASLAADTQVNFIDVGTATYVFNGTTATGKLVGATYTQPAGMPIGKYAAWVNDRLYVAGNPTYPNRLYFSGLNTPETFGGSDYIEVFPSSTSVITGLNSLGGVLVIGKTDNVYSFDGFTSDDFTVKSIAGEFPNYGVVSHRSMINIGDDLLFMSFSGSIPHIRSLKRTAFDQRNYGGVISEKIEGTLLRLNKSLLNRVAAGFDGRYVWWSVPIDAASKNNYCLVYDTFKEGWAVNTDFKAGVWIRSTLVGEDRLYYGDVNASKLVALNQDIGTREGEAIDFRFVSRYYRADGSRKSKFKYVYVTTGSDNSTEVDVYGSPDGFTSSIQDTLDPAVMGSVFPMTFPFFFGSSSDKKHRVNLAAQPAYTYQLEFRENEASAGTPAVFPLTFPFQFGGNDTDLVIKEYDVHYYPRSLRDA